MKLKQDLPYTGSRKGYVRMEEDMKKESADPSSITRVNVWCRGHTKKSGEASSQVVDNCLEKIQEFKASHPPNVSLRSYEDDALAHVLGPERRGRFRGIGSGVNASKLKFRAHSNAKVAQLEQKVETMMEQIERLGHIIIDQKSFIDKFINQDQQSREYEKMTQQKIFTPESNESVRNDQVVQKNTFGSQCQGVARNNQKVQNNLSPKEAQQDEIHKWKEGGKCLLYNWMNPTEIVAKGRWTSNDLDMLVHFKRLGNNASKVWVDKSLNGSALLWRQNSEMKTINDAIDTPIAWPTDYIIMMNENDDFMEDGDINEDEGFEY